MISPQRNNRRSFVIRLAIILLVPLLTLGGFLATQQREVGATHVPWNPTNLTDFVSTGPNVCAINDGDLYCWGDNTYGQAAVGFIGGSNVTTPNKVAGALVGKTVSKVAMLGATVCALAEGSVYCWGSNDYGQVGDNTTTSRSLPVAVDNSGVLAGKTITNVYVGAFINCAQTADSALYCWGSNEYGQLGDGSGVNQSTPVAVDTSGVLSGKTITKVAINNDSMCVIAAGQVYCWGGNSGGVAYPADPAPQLTPVALDSEDLLAGKTVSDISLGPNFGCLVADGDAYCWATNEVGEHGDGATGGPTELGAVDTSGALAGKTVTQISVAQRVTCAVASGAAYCWGNNTSGQLGNGTLDSSLVPVAVDTSGVLAGKTITETRMLSTNGCAGTGSQLYCWGDNGGGKLGNGTDVLSEVPVAFDESGVLAGKSITKVDFSDYGSCASAEGDLYCWGINTYGTVGDGTTDPRFEPQEVTDLEPTIDSVTPSSVTTNIPITIQLQGDDFKNATVTIGGVATSIDDQNGTSISLTVPTSLAVGDHDIVVTNGNGLSSTVTDGLHVFDPSSGTITGVSFGIEGGRSTLTITGTDLIGTNNSQEFADTFYRSIISLNGTALPFCALNTGLTVDQIISFLGVDPALVSDSPTCYLYVDAGPVLALTSTQAKIWLAPSFDITAPGTVKENNSNIFAFNQPSEPPETSVVIDEQDPDATPEVSETPTFSGKAPEGSEVTVVVHSDPVSCSDIADSNDDWSCTIATALPEGSHTVNITIETPSDGTIELGPYAIIVESESNPSETPTTSKPRTPSNDFYALTDTKDTTETKDPTKTDRTDDKPVDTPEEDLGEVVDESKEQSPVGWIVGVVGLLLIIILSIVKSRRHDKKGHHADKSV